MLHSLLLTDINLDALNFINIMYLEKIMYISDNWVI